MRLIGTIFTLALMGCAANPALPTYHYAGINTLGTADGRLTRSGKCVFLTGGERTVVPVWPNGTTIADDGIRLPGINGGEHLTFGSSVTLRGGYIGSLRDLPTTRRFTRCNGRPFMANHAARWHVGRDGTADTPVNRSEQGESRP